MSTVIEKILEVLQGQAETAVMMFDIAISNRSAVYRKAYRFLSSGPREFKTDWADWYRKRQAFHSLLNKLKRDGLIVRRKKRKNSAWSITALGLKKLVKLRETRETTRELSRRMYKNKNGDRLVIVAFDVPERERRKRNWLRAALIALGLRKLQQSVWAGKSQIPREFIRDLKDNSMLSYVHIFSVDKRGTIVEKSR